MLGAMIDPKGLRQALTGGRRALIFLHDNPDPDAIAAGWILAQIAESLGLAPALLHGGSLGRAENSAMVRHLGVPLESYAGQATRPRATDRFALVDTQPGAGNNAFPETFQAHVVIDHHPVRADLQAVFSDVRLDAGCTTTLLLSYHQAFGLDVTPALATAAFYAIVSETQDLEREATKADRDACLRLYPAVQLVALGKIRHPPREREYFRTVARAMRQVMLGKNTCICHVGPLHNAEMAAELADFLVAMKQVTWCLVSGFVQGQMVLSIRTRRTDLNAEQVMRRVVQDHGRGGGHDMMAGGALPCDDLERYGELAARVSRRFLEGLPRRAPENLRPLLDEDPPEAAEPAGDRG
jgi:nanoRNase/pAp phosphatase (c-di-AMP/oligoRNAs hydrolase)